MLCWYKNDQPILRYKPQKVERVWVGPEILMYRELLNKEQIDQLITQSLKKVTSKKFLIGEVNLNRAFQSIKKP